MARILREQYGDVSLPTAEALPELQRFTPEARRALERRGYRIDALTGQSIKTLRDAGKPSWLSWRHEDDPKLEVMPSRTSDVAIDPEHLFLPDSNRKTLREQEAMVEKFSKDLKIDGVEAVIGEMPDYVELTFNYLDVTGERLFGEDCNYDSARTKTPTDKFSVAHVGRFDAGRGLYVDRWRHEERGDGLWAAPLIVPAK